VKLWINTVRKDEDHAIRGGCWRISSNCCRASFHNWIVSGHRSNNLGFRVLHRRRKK